MRKLLLVAALAAAILTPMSSSALAAIRISVSPEQGKQGTTFSVSFVSDRAVSGIRWFTIEVTAPDALRTCEYTESATVTFVRRGQRVSVPFTPFDKSRWCPGEYRGIVRVDRRVRCGTPGVDRVGEYCSRNGSIIGRFSFHVAS
jgi:hypothetical protein